MLTYKTICGGQTNEIPFLMTLINCIDSVGLRHPYLDDLTSFYEMAYAGTPQLAGNFGDFGCSTLGDSARSQFIGFEEDYILTEKDEKNTGHSYYTSRHTSKCYYFPILKNDTFEFFGAILNNNKWSYKSNPSLVFQKDDLPELLLQFFRGTRNGFWRTSTHQIEPILNHYVEKYYSS